MTDPRGEQVQTLDPVHAGEDEQPKEQWPVRLVIFLRAMAGLALIKGLYHWAVICGLEVNGQGFELQSTPFQVATVFFAVIDLVAAVGLWLAAPWGAVVWLTSVISMAAVEALFPRIYGWRIWVIVIELVLLVVYLWLALMAAREQPP